MRQVILLIGALVFCGAGLWANTTIDTFGTGANQFTIDFVDISGDASSANGTYIGEYKMEGFIDPGYNYRMGKFEITKGQWTKFANSLGVPVTGSPSHAYDENPYWAGMNIPTNNVSWYEAAQFVNWLNTSTNHAPAYTFTGTQGTGGYTLDVWDASVAWGGTNLYRHKDTYYFLPTEDEWVKAAYWNGTSLQEYATKPGESLYQGNGSNRGWNYYSGGYATDPYGPWDVGSGSEELNGTYDMMGNVWEWMESPYDSGHYISSYSRGFLGGSYMQSHGVLRSSYRSYNLPRDEDVEDGFRVASVPEPTSLLILALGGLLLHKRKF